MRTLIYNATVVTNDREDRILESGYAVIDGSGIAEVGNDPARCKRLELTEERRVDARGKVLMPGMINAHTHSFQTFLRGFADNLPLRRWLEEAIFPRIAVMEEEDFYLASVLSCMENLRGGTTAVIDQHYVHTSNRNADMVLSGMQKTGIRGSYCRTFGDRNDNLTLREKPENICSEMERLYTQWHGSCNGRLSLMLGPGTAVCTTPATMQKTYAFAMEHGLRYQMHTLETEYCRKKSYEVHGKSEVEMLHDLGMLGPGMELAHGVWLTEPEKDLLEKSGAMVVHNPIANMYLASGVAPVREYLDRGIPVALGTDGPGSNNSQDMLEILKATACLQKVATGDALALRNTELLHMLWNGGARAVGREDIGSIEPGKKADLVLVELNNFHCMPVNDPVSALVYNANGNDVTDVWVDGEHLIASGKSTRIDEAGLMQACRERQQYLSRKIGA